MKITALTFIFALFAAISFAQIKKGTWTIDANSRIVDYYGAGTFYPSFGRRAVGFIDANYFFTPKLNVGTRFELVKYLNIGLRKVQYNVSPYFRYYFTPDKPLKLYGEVSLSFDAYEDPHPIMRIFQPKFEVGFNYFVSPNATLEFGIGTSQLEYAKGTTETYFGTHFNLVPRAGIRLFFNTEDTGNKKYLPKDYLKRGNYSVGLSGYISAQGDQYGIQKDLRLLRDYDLQSGYDFKLNFNYFLISRLSIGTSLELASYELPFCRMPPAIIISQVSRCEVKWRTGIVMEYIQPIDRKGNLQVSVGGGVVFRDKSGKYIETPGVNYRLIAKVQGFVTENISLWGGISYEPDIESTPRQLLREVTFVGIQYYMMSKRNRK